LTTDSERHLRPSWALLLIVPLVVGVLGGALVGVFVMVVEDWILGDLVLGLPGLWFAVPALGVFLLTRLALLKVAGTLRPGTAELYPTYYHATTKSYPLRQTPGRLLSGLTTVGLGGSQGLESQSVLIGDSVGVLMRRLFARRVPYLATPDGRRLVLVCGAAAGIATVFSSPTLGAAYGIEMPFRNKLDGRRLVPSMIAAAASFMTARLIHASRSLFVYIPHEITGEEVFGVLLVAVLCGFGARLFVAAVHRTRGWKDGARPWLRAALAGVALMSLAAVAFLVIGAPITAGPGYVASDWAVPSDGPSPTAVLILAALVFRVASVLLTVAAGGGGGVFTSMATNGLLIGAAVGVLLGLDDVTLLTMCGATAFLSAGYRLPLAGAGLLAESSGGSLPCALGVLGIGIAMVLVGRRSASGAQSDALIDTIDHDVPEVRLTRSVAD
jgi:CIC family chloride channel protein